MGFNPIEELLYIYLRAKKALDKRKTGARDFNPSMVRRILVVSSTAIGDTLMSTPAIRAVRRRYPKARITALFNAANMELFETNPNVDDVVPFYGGYRRFFSTVKRLKTYRFDLALIFHGNEPQATPLCYLAGAAFIFKLPNASRYRFLLSNSAPVVRWDALGHGIEARLKTAGLAGCRMHDVRMEVFIRKEDEEGVDGFLRSAGAMPKDILIGFHPGASTLSRQWFPERFIELGNALAKDPRVKIVLTGSPAEAGLCEKIARGVGAGVINAAGRLPLRQLPPLIRRLSAYVTGDTGPMHIAITAGTPVVALYAVADGAKTGPLYDRERHRVIQKERTCDPCVSKKCAYQKCMEAISVQEALDAVRGVLGVAGQKA